jgi:hypothetical protein
MILADHNQIFGKQPRGGGHKRRQEFLAVVQSSINFLPPYVNKEDPSSCNFPDFYDSSDYYSELCEALCFYLNGSHSKSNSPFKSIFTSGEPFYKPSGFFIFSC